MKTHPFSEVPEFEGIYSARAGKLNSFALRLRYGSLCIYNPVAGLERSEHNNLGDIGPVSAILAPNHYHNKGLKGHADAFPKTPLLCSESARPRLQKITGLTFDPLKAIEPLLTENQTLLEPQGLKTGEVWVQIETGSEVAWIVTDAFSAKLQPPGNYAETAAMLGTFPRYGVKDAVTFKDWVNEQMSAIRPTFVMSCHGSPVKCADLNTQLSRLLAEDL